MHQPLDSCLSMDGPSSLSTNNSGVNAFDATSRAGGSRMRKSHKAWLDRARVSDTG
jgi:hypothetical protein